jgi:hypothetical protein
MPISSVCSVFNVWGMQYHDGGWGCYAYIHNKQILSVTAFQNHSHEKKKLKLNSKNIFSPFLSNSIKIMRNTMLNEILILRYLKMC